MLNFLYKFIKLKSKIFKTFITYYYINFFFMKIYYIFIY